VQPAAHHILTKHNKRLLDAALDSRQAPVTGGQYVVQVDAQLVLGGAAQQGRVSLVVLHGRGQVVRGWWW
jgi:hypothetical protein